MRFAAADLTEESLAALLEDERCSDALFGLSEFAERAARAACAQADAQADSGAGPAAGETRSILSAVILVLLETAARLAMLSWRVWQGRGFPVRRTRTAEQAGRPAAAPRQRSAWEEARFADLAALGVPGAEAMRAELAALLADPGTAALVSSEPSVWRAAFRLARAFGLPVPPRPKTAEPEPPAASPPAAPPQPGTAGPARPRPSRPEPPPEGWFEYAAGAGPVLLPFARPEPASDPPPLRLKPRPRLQNLRLRLLRSAIGWA